jgi:hypothetical protein
MMIRLASWFVSTGSSGDESSNFRTSITDDVMASTTTGMASTGELFSHGS